MTTQKGARKAATRLPVRTVHVALKGEYEGWELTARASFPARVLELFQGEKMADIMAGMDLIVIEHNFPDQDGNIAATMSVVDPYEAVLEAMEGTLDAIGKLPPR